MPIKFIHAWLCGQLGIRCQFTSSKCPLDEGALHNIHHNTNPYAIPLRYGDFAATKLDHEHCEKFLNAHFQRMAQDFSALTNTQTRLCWTAHMICDHASDYYWEALEASGRRKWYWYQDFFYNDPGYKRFLLEMGRRFIGPNGSLLGELQTATLPACEDDPTPVSETDLAPIDPKLIQCGTLVFHRHYGQGRINYIERLGSTTKVTIDFGLSGGLVKFVLEKSSLWLVKEVPIGPSTYRSNQGDQMTFQEVIAALQRERPGAPLGETAKSGQYYDRAVRLTNFERYLGNPLRYGAMQPNGRMMWLYWTSGKICCGDKDWD